MTTWHDFFLHHSATSDDPNILSELGTSPSLSVYSLYVTKLCQKTTFFLSGEHAESFLQGQLTADCRHLSHSQASPTALCTHKGRMIATGIIEKTPTGYQLTVPRSIAETVESHLRKYILFSKVSLEKTAMIQIEAGGNGMTSLLTEHLGPLSKTAYGISHHDPYRSMTLPGPVPRFVIQTKSPEDAISLWDKLTDQAKPIDLSEQLDFDSHLISIDAELTELFLPQMIGYEHIGGMSLKKGCYAGQEVLARSSHRGNIKRHLYQGICDLLGIKKGMAIMIGQSDRSAGTVSAVSGNRVLAVLSERSIHEGDELTLAGSPLTDLKAVSPSLEVTH